MSSYKATANKLYCGSIESNNKVEPTFGYFEASIYIQKPSVTATQTAFWLMGDAMKDNDPKPTYGPKQGTGSDGAEVDIFESSWTNDKMASAVHCDGYALPYKFGSGGQAWTAAKSTEGSHLYGLLWRKDILAVYYDGVAMTSFTNAKYIPLVKEYVLLSCGAAFGDAAKSWPNRIIGSSSGTFVDYVRIYQIP